MSNDNEVLVKVGNVSKILCDINSELNPFGRQETDPSDTSSSSNPKSNIQHPTSLPSGLSSSKIHHPKFKIYHSLLLILFLVALEIAIPAWRRSAPVSTAPIFSLPMARAAMNNPGKFQTSIDVYHADRGGELTLPGPDGTSLTVFYFEWDQIEAGPKMAISGHKPENCNIASGLTVESRSENRSFMSPGNFPLVFDATTFADLGGRQVYFYKAAWLQGFGSWGFRDRDKRHLRFKNAFDHGRGAARVIECGVSGAQNEAHAWQIFQTQVLQQLSWSSAKDERPARP
jgi:hypothetical protein